MWSVKSQSLQVEEGILNFDKIHNTDISMHKVKKPVKTLDVLPGKLFFALTNLC